MRSDQLWVSELFGPTVQGEGPTAGRIRYFLRTAGCNLDCSWCDTRYTWDWANYDKSQETSWRPIEELADWAQGKPLVITGGEPMLQAAKLNSIIGAAGFVEIETNGTIAPGALATLPDQFNVSPKLPRFTTKSGIDIGVLRDFVALQEADVAFKFVAQSLADLDELSALIDAVGVHPSSVWISPEGVTRDEWVQRLEALADAVIRRGWNLSPRLHVLAWGSERGR